MTRICTVLLVVVASVAVADDIGARTPAARLLQVKGSATVLEADNFDRPATIYGTIYADERLVVAKDAHVTLVFRGDGHIERVVAPGTFRITASGCQPQKGVEQVAMSEPNRAVVGKISKGSRGIVQGGVVMARSPAPPEAGSPQEDELPIIAEPGKVRPISESTLLAANPEFSWPAVPKAKTYTLTLYFLGDQIWSATSETPKLKYVGDDPMKAGGSYSWEVATTIGGKTRTVCEGAFQMASERQRADHAALQKLLATPDPSYLALAAIWYKQNGFMLEAIAVNQQLAKLTPDPAIYRELAELCFLTGNDQEGNAAAAKADELEK